MLLSSTASASNTENKDNNGEKTALSTESTNNNTEENTEEAKPEENLEEEAVESPDGETEVANDGAIFIGQKPDSTNVNSVSKFNFIFYFIYKLKYEEDPNSIGHLNYEF